MIFGESCSERKGSFNTLIVNKVEDPKGGNYYFIIFFTLFQEIAVIFLSFFIIPGMSWPCLGFQICYKKGFKVVVTKFIN